MRGSSVSSRSDTRFNCLSGHSMWKFPSTQDPQKASNHQDGQAEEDESSVAMEVPVKEPRIESGGELRDDNNAYSVLRNSEGRRSQNQENSFPVRA